MTVQKLFIILGILAVLISSYRNLFRKNGDGLLLNIIQYFVGLLLIFSGFVKAIDPTGTAYKMKDYFDSFAQDGFAKFWDTLAEGSLLFALAMIIFEIALGIMILIGWKPRWTLIGLLALNLFFLYLTGYSYLSGFCLAKHILVVSALLMLFLLGASFLKNRLKRFQGLTISVILIVLYFIFIKFTGKGIGCEFTMAKMKVTDCGCFGDFMKLKPWETFYKDIFLTFLSVYLVRYYHKVKSITSLSLGNMIVAGGTILAALFCFYNTFWNEPVVDFRPYKLGNNLNEQMKEIKPSIVENMFIYKNNQTGAQQKFAATNFPADIAENWTYVDRIDSVIQEGIAAPIHNLRLEDASGGGDVTTSMLSEAAPSYWVVIYNIDKTNMEAIESTVFPWAAEMRKKGTNVYCLLGKSSADFEKKAKMSMDIVHADETALKTMIRSNPGILKIENGVVKNKWHHRHFSGLDK